MIVEVLIRCKWGLILSRLWNTCQTSFYV